MKLFVILFYIFFFDDKKSRFAEKNSYADVAVKPKFIVNNFKYFAIASID